MSSARFAALMCTRHSRAESPSEIHPFLGARRQPTAREAVGENPRPAAIRTKSIAATGCESATACGVDEHLDHRACEQDERPALVATSTRDGRRELDRDRT